MQHRQVKRYYARTNKKNAPLQIAKHLRREAIIRAIASKDPSADRHVQVSEVEDAPLTSLRDHHHISDSQRSHSDILAWVHDNRWNPGIKVSCRCNRDPRSPSLTTPQGFIPRLKGHLLARYKNIPYDGEEHAFSDEERDTITFSTNRMYRHEMLRINYTTYDARRAQDSVNVKTHPYIMVLGHEDEGVDSKRHPYWYAKVLGIYHVNIRVSGQMQSQRMEFLWVHWFGRDPDHEGGFKTRRLHRIGLLDPNDPDSYGFLDPGDVLRAVHLIPAFEIGRKKPVDSEVDEDDEDWENYYISM
jgi:hypothetical protein